MPFAKYKVIISKGAEVVCEVTAAWPPEDDPNPHLSQILADWEAERGKFLNGKIIISFEMIS